jgi:hypothetical protein
LYDGHPVVTGFTVHAISAPVPGTASAVDGAGDGVGVPEDVVLPDDVVLSA